MRHIRRSSALLVAVVASAILLSGCSAQQYGSGGDIAVDSADGEVVSGGDTGEAGSAEEPGEADRAVVITGSIVITVDDPIEAATDATAIVTEAGGRVDARNEIAPRDDEEASATLTLRVPADSVEEVRAQLAELGDVDETQFDAVEVGATQRDLEVRIRTLRTSIARYTDWLSDATETTDLIKLETAIADRQTQLETLEAEQRALADQIAMSTITLHLRSEGLAPPPEGPSSFVEGVAVGWNAFVGFWAGVAVAAGIGLPWLLLLGAIAAAIVVVVRRASKERPQEK
ncbi:DUF4349 domain-containing protein [Homoserinibacter sp. GY 40078]|uniref:DUF4349 domain-containing protein n=1 Tax=Homoserinibacter sp. GY 40078 TaxID=2603275 RepID=UPI0011CA8BE5|nr:DUF4349 domain-containing protein [Homoserinibacter sp. GY 40078]TXK19451.1 DUF4349 domain-containing protein [Homoserinibacter sp. GY 40078]